MRKVKLALAQMPPTFTDMPLKCVPLPFFDIRNSVVVALVLCSFHLLIRDILLFKFQHLLSPLSKNLDTKPNWHQRLSISYVWDFEIRMKMS